MVMISTIEEIQGELKVIQYDLEVEMSEDINEATYRGNKLAVHMARTGKLLADAKIHRDKKLTSTVVDELKKILSLPPSTANKFLDAVCYEENHLVNWSERVNRTCTHQLDWCRTIISKAKAEMNAFGGNMPNN